MTQAAHQLLAVHEPNPGRTVDEAIPLSSNEDEEERKQVNADLQNVNMDEVKPLVDQDLLIAPTGDANKHVQGRLNQMAMKDGSSTRKRRQDKKTEEAKKLTLTEQLERDAEADGYDPRD